jgi:hypothetical protein
MHRRKLVVPTAAALLFGALLVPWPAASTIPRLSTLKGLTSQTIMETPIGFFAPHSWLASKAGGGYPRRCKRTSYDLPLTVNDSQAIADLSKDLGPPTRVGQSSVAEWRINDISRVRITRSGSSGIRSAQLRVYVYEELNENPGQVIVRMFKSRFQP